MKKHLLFLLIILLSVSCKKKQDDTPTPTPEIKGYTFISTDVPGWGDWGTIQVHTDRVTHVTNNIETYWYSVSNWSPSGFKGRYDDGTFLMRITASTNRDTLSILYRRYLLPDSMLIYDQHTAVYKSY